LHKSYTTHSGGISTADKIHVAATYVVRLLKRMSAGKRPYGTRAFEKNHQTLNEQPSANSPLYLPVNKISFTTMMKVVVFALLASAVVSFAPISQTLRQPSLLQESFGLGIGEDSYTNQPVLLRGEQEYKQFVNKYKEDNMLNRKVKKLWKDSIIILYMCANDRMLHSIFSIM
jgi:hypothetical protein